MSIDSAWIFRICLLLAVMLILFADFLGYGGANARRNDKSEDYEDYTADEQPESGRRNKGEQAASGSFRVFSSPSLTLEHYLTASRRSCGS